MDGQVYFTYTCPVSRKTYAGHPRDGHLYTHNNDLEEAVSIIHSLARRHSQPVTWVINDQEYTDQEGLLHYFRRFHDEGDSILVTMELTTSPSGVDKYDTQAVLAWIDDRCREAGLHIDGLWSLRFLESDLAAISGLDCERFGWARNLAGSCWHQIGIDESTWGGCPYNPYYVSRRNVRAPARPGESGEFLMFEWLSRDIPAILAGGFPATFSLDPADSNRRDSGGFDNEPDALRYSQSLISELARQVRLNPTVVINVNEEARHFQTEGHDKAFMLDGMFACATRIQGMRRIGYGELYSEFRRREPRTPDRLFVCESVDWRAPKDTAALYEDVDCQMGFLRSAGPLPVEYFDYAADHQGQDSNEAYPQTGMAGVKVKSVNVESTVDGVDISLEIESERGGPAPGVGLMVWNAKVRSGSRVIKKSAGVISARVGLDGCAFIRAEIESGHNLLNVRFGS